MKIITKIAGLLLLVSLFSSCQTIREASNFAKSEFRIKDIQQLNLGNVDLKNINALSDLKLQDAAQLGLALKNKNLPLTLTYLIEVRNPNAKTAALEKLDWVLELDKTDLIGGTSNDRVEVAPNGGVTTFPLSIGMNAGELLNKESIQSMVNLLAAVKGDNQDQSRLRLKIKPRFRIAGIRIGYPGFIKVGKTFEASKEEDVK